MINNPICKKVNIVVQELEKELLVYDLSTNKAYVLNETSALVYHFADGKRTIQEISDAMSVKLKTLVSEDFVWLALNELKRDGLLENSDEINSILAKINRREVVKKIGFASLIALPIISSVVAPSAATAASATVVLFGACTNSSQCLEGQCQPCQGNCPSSACCKSSNPFQTFGSGSYLGCLPLPVCFDDGAESCCSGAIDISRVSLCANNSFACYCV